MCLSTLGSGLGIQKYPTSSSGSRITHSQASGKMPRPIVETHVFFCLFHRRITATFDRYLDTGDSSVVTNMATVIYAQKQVWTNYCSEDPAGKYFKPRLFDEVLARVIRQEAALCPPASWQQNMLVQFCLHGLESSQNPIGSLNVETLITETGTQLISLRTQLLGFVQDEAEAADIPTTIAKFTNLGCFMSALAADAVKRPVYPLNEHDLWSLGQVGVELVLGILQADSDFDIHEDLIRLNIFKTCITWFDENSEFLSKELCEEHDLYLCESRLCSFLDSDWLEDDEGEYTVLVHKAEDAMLMIIRNLDKRFGRQSLRRIFREYGEDWVEWVSRDLRD